MQLFFQGADYNVTGSRHILKINQKQILMDCGLFQGARRKQLDYNRTLSFDASSIDAMLLSHAHIDHSGNIPNLVKSGFKGQIFTTEPTKDLCEYMLRDSAYIQEKDIEYLNEKRHRENLPLLEPIYTIKDSEQALTHFRGMPYDTEFKITPEVKVTFREAGHILGSAISELEIFDTGQNVQRKIVYTGDLGRKNLPLLRDPYQVSQADYLIIESTYGNRLHESIDDVKGKLAEIMKQTCRRGGKLIIPAFALGRTQEIIYKLHRLIQENQIPDVPIYVDSPLANNVTEVFKKYANYFDSRTQEFFLKRHEDPLWFKRLTYVTDVEESKKLNNHPGPCVIISASGMCEFGRILHHLKNNIEDDRNTILIVGYMAKETLGRKLIEGYKSVNIFGKPHIVRAHLEVIDAFSAHADRSDLLDYILKINGLRKVFLVHGEEDQLFALKNHLKNNGMSEDQIVVPRFGDEIELN